MKQIVKVVHDTSGQFSVGDITDKPCNTLTQATAHWAVYEQEVPDGIGGGQFE